MTWGALLAMRTGKPAYSQGLQTTNAIGGILR